MDFRKYFSEVSLQRQKLEITNGPAALKDLLAGESRTEASGADQNNINRIQMLMRTLQQVSGSAAPRDVVGASGDPTMSAGMPMRVGGTVITAEQASRLYAAGLEGQQFDPKSINSRTYTRAVRSRNLKSTQRERFYMVAVLVRN